MEAEPLELEDGEVVDDETTDVFETYKVLERPSIVKSADTHVKMGNSDESDDSVDSESDSDSDCSYVNYKRPKLKLKKYKNIPENCVTKNDKYKVWCTQVQEESLTEDLVSCGVTKKLYQERSVESYNFTLRYSLDGAECFNNSSDDDKDTERRFTNKRTNSDRYNAKLRLGKKNSMEIDSHKSSAKLIADLNTTVNSTDSDVATDITTKLSEKQDMLIKRIVTIIGKEKAIEFFHKTKKIEESGGMLIMNGSRRRTAGGVYLWLVKHDKHIPRGQIRQIFYNTGNIKGENKSQELIKNIENGSEKDLPALLTRAELSTKQIAEEAKLRRGEGMDRIPLDSDRTVTNPPPSPVTDDPDHSDHSLAQRQVQDYAEDYLDIGVDIGSMEVL